MLNPEMAKRCLEAMVHNIFKWLSSDKKCSSFAVCCLLISISETANILGNGLIHFGVFEHFRVGIILLLNHIIIFSTSIFNLFITKSYNNIFNFASLSLASAWPSLA